MWVEKCEAEVDFFSSVKISCTLSLASPLAAGATAHLNGQKGTSALLEYNTVM